MPSGSSQPTRYRKLGREPEAHAIDVLLDSACTSPAGLVIEGEAGIGKTTLWWEATERASRRGFRVLAAQGASAEVKYAYAAVADLLRDTIDADAIAALTANQRAAVERALSGAAEGPESDERSLAAAFSTLIDQFTVQSPVLVAIDDAQYLDASSQAVIGYAAKRFTGRTRLLVTMRTGESTPVEAAEWLRFPHPEDLSRLRMSALTLGGVHTLVSDRLGYTLPRPVVTRIHEISGGNPFFALELARAIPGGTNSVAENLPANLAALVRRRIGEHDEQTATVLLAAACSPSPTVDLIHQACDVSPQVVVESLEAVEARGVVAIDGNRVQFTHPLFATGVYTDAAPARRRAMHRALADIVDVPEAKARHLALATTTGDPTTQAALDAAADVALSKGAPSVAAELVEMAIKLGGDIPARRLRAAEMHFRAGSLTAARLRLEDTIDELPRGNALRCLGLMLLGAVNGYDDNLLAAVDALAKAADESDTTTGMHVQALLLLIPALGLVGRWQDCIFHADAAVVCARQLGHDGLLSQTLAMHLYTRFMYGLGTDPSELRMARELEPSGPVAHVNYRARAAGAVMASWAGRLDDARAELEDVLQKSTDAGAEADIIWVTNHLGMCEVWAGRYAEAARIADDATLRAEQFGGQFPLVAAMSVRATAAAYLGDEDVAERDARAAIEAADRIGGHFLQPAARTSLAFLDVSRGNYKAALSTLEPLLSDFDVSQGTEIVHGGWLPDAIEALAATQRMDDADALIAALETNGARLDRPWMLATAARGRGHVLAARGDLPGAEDAVQNALDHHDRLSMPFERARTLLLLGQLQRRRRRRQAAAASLDQALDVFERLGTSLWTQRARAAANRLSTAVGHGLQLTGAEHRVANLAAEGLSNKQIAAQLFIAEKTVEMNLSSVYRKLGIRSRGGLASRLRSEVQGNP